MNNILNVKDIPKHFICIYKLNFPNGKSYIGQTINLKRRMWEHNNPSSIDTPCDRAINKYGKISEVEILEQDFPPELIDEKEIYWIQYYNAYEDKNFYNLTPGGKTGETITKSGFTKEEIIDIRRRKYNKERKLEVYQDYNSHSLYSFEGIWENKTFLSIGREFFTDKDESIYSGEYNGSTILTADKVASIREDYVLGLSQKEIEIKNPDIPKTTINNILSLKSWKYLPLPKNYNYQPKRGISKLVEEDVKNIKILYMQNISLENIFNLYNDKLSSLKQLKLILQEKKWKDVIVEGFIPLKTINKKISTEIKQQVIALYNQNYSMEEIINKTDVSKSTYYRIINSIKK